MVLFTDDYLEHHGVLGQKWGVRRYQNKDGSLTRLGRKRQQAQSVSFSETSPAVDHGTYLEYPKGSVFGRVGEYDTDYPVYLYTNEVDRKMYSERFGGKEYAFVTTRAIKRPSYDEQIKMLSEFAKDKSVLKDPYYYWKDNINQGGYFADDYFRYMQSKGYSALLDIRNYGLADDAILLLDHSVIAEINAEIKHHDMRCTEMQFFTNDYLEHHGVLGQKWGVRRYQNKDGSLTAVGKKRLSSGSGNSLAGAVTRLKAKREASKIEKAKKKPQPIDDYMNARNKPLSQMTNEELKKGYDRLKMENLYKAEYQKQHKETPKEYVKRVAVDAAKKHGEKVAEYMIGKAINKAFGAEVISGLATKQNVDSGKQLADQIRDEVSRQLKGTQQTPKESNSPSLGERAKKAATKAKEAAGKMRDSNQNAAINAAAEYVKSGKKAYDHVREGSYHVYDDKVYEGEVVYNVPATVRYKDRRR